MTEEDATKNTNIQANDNSVAVGNINVGGSIDGNLTIGNTYNYATLEDDAPISSEELEKGLTRFAEYLPERAPVLQEKFASIAKKIRLTLGAELSALSPILKTQREDTVNQMKLMCMEALDISFRALCTSQHPPPYDSRSPFQGLVAFRPESKEFYFGREVLIQKLVTCLAEHPFLAVMGASGSGKSSLVMAGLIPALEAQMSYLTPSSTPLERLHTAQENADKDTVYVVDQFEELFTLTRDASAREAFMKELLELAKTNRVVITMRADFWGEVATYKDLKQAMQDHQELIAPMDTDELHSAMEQQAAAVNLRFDSTLSESILEEVKGAPGAMPLLQHALWMLWKRRHGLWLKAEEYRAFGGVNQAIASTADEVYASCSDFEQDRIQNIFLRLTRLDDSGEGRDTRRRVLIEDLFPANSDSMATTQLLNKLADARLIVKTDKEVEVAHEALIRHWSRLTHWLNDDRDNLRLREGVSEDAREWEKSNRDESLLNHRGGRLELALAMSQNPRYQLNPTEHAYLNACVEVRERARIEKEQQQQRELETAKKLAETAEAKARAERRGRLVGRGLLVIAAILIIVLSKEPIRREMLRQQAMKSEMVNIPAGDYILGDQQRTEENPNWYLVYQTYHIPSFSIDPYPVTNGRYGFCIQAGICLRPNTLRSNYEGKVNAEKPVTSITGIDAATFCNWIGQLLPSDKEWELASRKLGDIRPAQDSRYPADHFIEWTRSSFDEKESEWTDLSKDPPEVLTQKGGFLDEPLESILTFRQSSSSISPDPTTGFRCVINH
jgi:formylglycine-generating enzyme required for sulfatase activity